MNVFIVYAHPSQKSYTYKILKKVIAALEKENYNIELSDLYAMNFCSDMNEEEYEREGFAETEKLLSLDVIKEQKKIENADCIIFLYPVWWSDCPAKLKGWFDRVFSVGYAYGYNEVGEGIKSMRYVKFGLALCTAGHSNDFLEEIGIAKSMNTVMINDRLGKRFENKEMIIFGGTLELEKNLPIHEKYIDELVCKIKKYCAE